MANPTIAGKGELPHISVVPSQASAPLAIRRIGFSDLWDALAKGFSDFAAKPSHLVFLGIIYPIFGILLGGFVFGNEMLPLMFPLMAGFALVGPFAAIGLYEISRRRELGLDTSWEHAFEVFRSPSIVSIAAAGMLLLLLFLAWLVAAMLIYGWAFGGRMPDSMGGFLNEVLTTQAGWKLIVVGNLVGFCFALASLAISVVSFPLLLDRNVDVGTAVKTSIKAVRENPVTMLGWGLVVAVILALGTLPLFVGLAIAVPVLGHATWHLYRKVVQR